MRSRNFVIGLVSSLAVVAVALGLLVLLGPADGDDLALPDRLDGLVATDVEDAYPDGEPPAKVVERAREANEVNSDGYADVFDGAAADTRAYTDPQDAAGPVVGVVAVRADVGPLVPSDGFVDPEQLGLALPLTERVTDGDVECLLFRSAPPRAGTDYQPDQALPVSVTCQRHAGSLSVRVRWTGGEQDRVVDLVEDLWDELD